MAILKALGDAIAHIFTGGTVGAKVARAVVDPRISEPVFMMLQSIKENPHHWRVELVLPKTEPEMKRKDSMARMRDYRRCSIDGPITVRITDRNVGEKYEATLLVDPRVVDLIIFDRAMGRISDCGTSDFVRMGNLIRFPDWLNPQEARELHYALNTLMFNRINAVRAYKNRQRDRAEKDAAVRAQARREQERQRLINVYGAHKND